MALTWSAAVIGLSAETVSATALPFSISGGRSIFTLPFFADASPSTFLIAPRIDSGVADEGTVVSARLTLPASAAASIRKRRRVAYGLSSLLVIMVASVRGRFRQGRFRRSHTRKVGSFRQSRKL